MITHNEKKVKQKFINLISDLGYKFLSIYETKTLRLYLFDSQFLLSNNTINHLKKINNINSKEIILEQFKKIEKITKSEGLIKENLEASKMIFSGTTFYNNDKKTNQNFKFFDLKNLENNVFEFTEEFPYFDSTTKDSRRFDLVLFINGIPIIVVELKDELVGLIQAFKQLKHYQRKDKSVGSFFTTVQILIASNNIETKYSTVGSPWRFWNQWKYTELDKTIIYPENKWRSWELFLTEVCVPKKILYFCMHFVCHQNHVKKIARYNQYRAVYKIFNKLPTKQEEINKGGVLWHTQGSGKSLTMVFLANKIICEKKGAKIVVVSDRNDLDWQNTHQFLNTEFYIQSYVKNIKNAQNIKKLNQYLNEYSDLVSTTIHKANSNTLTTNKNKNIYVFIDEGHRSNFGLFHKSLKKILPNGTYIAFTGTPIDEKNKRSIDVFGKFRDIYKLKDAVEDGFIVPYAYEDWSDAFQLVGNIEETEKIIRENKKFSKKQYEDFKKKVKNKRNIDFSINIIKTKTKAVYEYLTKNNKIGMLVVQSRDGGVRYFNEFKKLNNDFKVALIMSPIDAKKYETVDDDIVTSHDTEKWYDQYMKKNPDYEKEMRELIQKKELTLIIVINKWLTGYDEPNLEVIFLDRKFDKKHSLAQAIARVNRSNETKKYGVIIDFQGQIKQIEKTLAYYDNDGFHTNEKMFFLANIKHKLEKTKNKIETLINDETGYFPIFTEKESDFIVMKFQKKNKKQNELFANITSLIRCYRLAESSHKIKKDEINWSYYKKLIRQLLIIRKQISLLRGDIIYSSENRIEIQGFIDKHYFSEKEILYPLTDESLKLTPEIFETKIEKFNSDELKLNFGFKSLERYLDSLDEKKINIIKNEKLRMELNKLIKLQKDKIYSNVELLEKLILLQKKLFAKKKYRYNDKINNPLKETIYDILLKININKNIEDNEYLTLKVYKFVEEKNNFYYFYKEDSAFKETFSELLDNENSILYDDKYKAIDDQKEMEKQLENMVLSFKNYNADKNA